MVKSQGTSEVCTDFLLFEWLEYLFSINSVFHTWDFGLDKISTFVRKGLIIAKASRTCYSEWLVVSMLTRNKRVRLGWNIPLIFPSFLSDLSFLPLRKHTSNRLLYKSCTVLYILRFAWPCYRGTWVSRVFLAMIAERNSAIPPGEILFFNGDFIWERGITEEFCFSFAVGRVVLLAAGFPMSWWMREWPLQGSKFCMWS